MEEFIEAMWGGPGHFRFFLQPLLAIALGLKDGLGDAKAHREPYIHFLFHGARHPGSRILDLIKRLALPLAIAVVMGVILQWVIRGSVHPAAAIVYAALFVAFPYVLTRALSNRAFRHRMKHPAEV